MRILCIFVVMLYANFNVSAQTIEEQIKQTQQQLELLAQQQLALEKQLEGLKLEAVRADLKAHGLPKVTPEESLVEHAAYSLVYDENHEQAKWVAHIITPDIIKGNVSRSNDFREDPLVKTGTTVEADYFLKELQADSSYKYDGFGYDRGHLAPSADFRWSALALSESYFYSNMSPQVPEFNRGRWAELESLLRAYIFENPNTQLYVVSGPVLKDDLDKMERSIHQLSIPEQYFKVVLDRTQQRGIAFLMPNEEAPYPVESYAASIDKIEALTGIDFFPNLPDEMEKLIEQQDDPKFWLPIKAREDVEPIYPPNLPPMHFNTVQAKQWQESGETVSVCGTVVSTKLTRKGHVFLNLDKQFPRQIFTLTIWKDDKLNFSYEPQIELKGRKICIKGKVTNFNGTPTMNISNEQQIQFFDQIQK